ncbi:proteasome maturation protein-like [Oppia nitens]|uniref:proteasome maturation protein-like n=1 Tax=Oppia nitens TaxID=1686743 RepID=UPI0023DBBBFA|nr:proteasome maturation protein-like [Oppia nitens]
MSLPTKQQRLVSADDGGCSDDQLLRPPQADNNILLNGFRSIRQQVTGRHPLEALDKTYDRRTDGHSFQLLKSIQGIHAPLRLIHERRAAGQINRLPGLQSSNLMLDVLTGRDETISPEDFLNDVSQYQEVMAPTHLLCERQFNI